MTHIGKLLKNIIGKDGKPISLKSSELSLSGLLGEYVNSAKPVPIEIKNKIKYNFQELLKEYKNENTLQVYRGISCNTEFELNQIKSNIKNNRIYYNTISSWTTSLEVAKSHASETKFGVILLTSIPAGVGIDINKKKQAISDEHEIILPPGRYNVTFENINKK